SMSSRKSKPGRGGFFSARGWAVASPPSPSAATSAARQVASSLIRAYIVELLEWGHEEKQRLRGISVERRRVRPSPAFAARDRGTAPALYSVPRNGVRSRHPE